MTDPNYNDTNGPTLYPGVAPVPPQSSGIINYLKQNKIVAIVILLILIGLIYWYFMKRNAVKETSVTTNITTPGPGNGTKITRVRTSNAAGGPWN